ncbi:Alpha/Beta hydrolase protein [Infundibulicybe gibba]|nr:Alpha/Beta hydrolase protein [Infundibulicybe gibba]
MPIERQDYCIAGLHTHVFREAGTQSKKDVVVFFLLHGRFGSAEGIEDTARNVAGESNRQEHNHDLFVVTFDHRNHGTRLRAPNANNSWSKDPAKHNEQHAIDMYGIQMGTARDVSFLVDFLPGYLFPSGERTIVKWGVGGISLGGHSTWITLSQDPRVVFGVPIIGCPDYLTLISGRARKNNLPVEPPYIPTDLMNLIKRYDPASQPYQVAGSANPFFGKRVLVLSGEIDTLVPWTASEKFVDELEVGAGGVKDIKLQAGVGHECTEKMVEEMCAFVIKEVL